MPRTLLACLLLIVTAPLPVHSTAGDETELAPQASPRLMHYQGRFTDDNGIPLPGPVRLRFTLFKDAEGGPGLWTELHDEVALDDGACSVLLGSVVNLPVGLFEDSELYLAVTVGDGDELSPRFRLVSVPYAFESARLGGKSANDFEPKGAVLALVINDNNPPNQGSNRVHWNNLTGVPEDLADGVDDGAVAHSQLQGLGDDDHPQYPLKSELTTSDGSGPNLGKKMVHWDNLVGVPSGFADGADNTGAGGATSHSELTDLDADDHPQYALDTDLDAHGQAADPHLLYATDADLAAHAADTTLHGGGGGSATTDASDLVTGLLDPARLAAQSITGDKLAVGAVNSEAVQDSSITGADLAAGALDSLVLGPLAVETSHLAPGAVTGDKLAADAVAGAKVLDGTLTGADVQDETLTGADIQDGSISSADISNGGITGDDVQDESLTGADVLDASITGLKIQNGTLTGVDIQSGTISSAQIQDNSITTNDIQDNTLGALDMMDESGVADTSLVSAQALSGPASTVLVETVDCPAAGWVLAIATAEACIDQPLVVDDQRVVFSVSETLDSLDPATSVTMRAQPDSGTVFCSPVTSQGVFQVAAGTRTLHVVAQAEGAGPATLSRIRLSLVYLPTRY